VHSLLVAALLFAAAGLRYGPEKLPAVSDAEDPLVDAGQLVPDLIVELAYASADNFTHSQLYDRGARCWLRRSAAERLARVAARLRKSKLRLVAWDCARSHEAQLKLWKAWPHPGGVADPERGSLHERGVAVDVGLRDLDGKPVPLPTAFDAFGPGAHAQAKLADGAAQKNRDLLRAAMHEHGFRVNPKEWWHFSRLYGWRWPVAQVADQAAR